MKFILILVLFGCIQSFSDAANECIAGTNEKCVPFTYEGVAYDKCEGYWILWCVGKDQTGSEYSSCGECVEPEPIGNEFDVPANHKTAISEDKFSTVSTKEDEVTKETSIESSGNSIDDTEPSIETTGNVVDDNEFDVQLDVPISTKGKKCVYGTNKICTPFTYRGINYNECYAGLYSYQCLVDGEWSYCGDCIEGTTVSDTTTVSTTEASKVTSIESSGDSNDDTETTENIVHDTETSVEISGDNTDDTEYSIEATEGNINYTEPSIGALGKPTESTELDEQLDVPISARKQKNVLGTNIVCTPFVHNGEVYDDCATNYWMGDWCLVETSVKTFYPSCGECVEQL